MVRVFCNICKEEICKYEMDFNSTGAIEIKVNYPGKEVTELTDALTGKKYTKEIEINDQETAFICNDCAKKIALKLIEDNC